MPWLAFLLFSLPAFCGEIVGTVVAVIDGDTVEVLDAERTVHRVRLAGIDAPERGQAFGKRAKRALLARVAGKPVTVDWHKRDRYRRIVAKLMHDGRDANLAMVASGNAWWYRKYAGEQSETDRGLYEQAEHRARTERVGLWRDPDPVPPWEWRHRPPPPADHAAACPCGSGKVCTGRRGGRFCVRESGSKRYLPRKP